MYNIYRYSEKSEPYKHVLMHRGAPEGEKAEFVESETRLINSLSRTRRLFHDYAYCNQFDLFCTFTFSPEKIDRNNFDDVSKSLSKFFMNFRQRTDSNFRYMVIPEQHEDGAWHFHGFCTAMVGLCSPLQIPLRLGKKVRYVKNTKGYLSWPAYSDRFGYFSASVIRDYDKIVSYCINYITKSFFDAQFKGKHLLLKSQKLNKPEKVFSSYGGCMVSPEFSNEFCSVKWADEYETSKYYRHWSFEDGEVRQMTPFENDAYEGEQLQVEAL